VHLNRAARCSVDRIGALVPVPVLLAAEFRSALELLLADIDLVALKPWIKSAANTASDSSPHRYP
jgi:hypothetical protein